MNKPAQPPKSEGGFRVTSRLMKGRMAWAWFFALMAGASGAGDYSRAQGIQEMEVPARLSGSSVMAESLATGTASITGTAIDGVTNLPVPGAIVSLGRSGTGANLRSVVCDSHGRFVLTELPDSPSYTLVARRSGYSESYYSKEEPELGISPRPAEVALSASQWRQGLEIRMWRLGEISGHVFDEAGEPLVGVAVRAFGSTTVNSKTFLAGSSIATTDDRGVFRLVDLRPGSYKVAILNSQATVPDAVPESPQRRAIGALFSGGLRNFAVRLSADLRWLSNPASVWR